MSGFTAGVLRIAWAGRLPDAITGQPGLVYPAQIVECATRAETLPAGILKASLMGLVVRAPDGQLSRVTGVEAFATMHLGPANGSLGLLLVPVEER